MGKSRIGCRQFCQQYGDGAGNNGSDDCNCVAPRGVSPHERYAKFIDNPRKCKKTERKDFRQYRHFVRHKRNLREMIHEAHPSTQPTVNNYTSDFRHLFKSMAVENRDNVLEILHNSIRFAQTNGAGELQKQHLQMALELNYV